MLQHFEQFVWKRRGLDRKFWGISDAAILRFDGVSLFFQQEHCVSQFKLIYVFLDISNLVSSSETLISVESIWKNVCSRYKIVFSKSFSHTICLISKYKLLNRKVIAEKSPIGCWLVGDQLHKVADKSWSGRRPFADKSAISRRLVAKPVDDRKTFY